MERNKVGLFCYIYYDFHMMVLYKSAPQNMEGKITKNMICTCKYYITLSLVELFKVLLLQRLVLQLGSINLMLLSNLKFWYYNWYFWEKFILCVWKVLKSICSQVDYVL